MRIDPSHIGEQMRQLGAAETNDASKGQRADQIAADLAAATDLESVDEMLLRRLQLSLVDDAATEMMTFADVEALVERTRELMGDSAAAAKAAQTGLDRSRVRDLLGE